MLYVMHRTIENRLSGGLTEFQVSEEMIFCCVLQYVPSLKNMGRNQSVFLARVFTFLFPQNQSVSFNFLMILFAGFYCKSCSKCFIEGFPLNLTLSIISCFATNFTALLLTLFSGH